MVYRYEWTWNWHAWQRLFAIDKSKIIAEMEKKLREKLTQEKTVTKIESMTTTITKEWNEYVLGIYHNHINGTTKTVFLSTVKEASPPIPIALIVVAVCAVLLALFIYLSIQSIGSTIKEVPEIVPTVGVLGLGAIALIGLFLFIKMKEKKT